MKTTRYFEEQAPSKRPYIEPEWCVEIMAHPLKRVEQADGRLRFWGRVRRAGEATHRILRVIVLNDGETVHNAFFDRDFREDEA